MYRTTPLPVTNLRERIAALEQRNVESVQRATSPTPSLTSNNSQSGPSNGALRDKIARFEKKGGVPVPRGRFGLGAPSSIEGPRRRGELYGNRIPVSTRTTSSGTLPLSRPGSMVSYDQRRSFSASSVTSDFDDDHLDYSPLSSPTFTLPPDSPDSTTSVSNTPDILPPSGDFSNFKQRGISFAKALEAARKAESEKQERQNSTSLASRSPPPSEATETAPTIVISSEDVSPVTTPEISTESATSVPSITPRHTSPSEKVQPNKELSYKPPEVTIANSIFPATMTTTHNPLVANGVARVGTPPLNIRKRTPTDPSIPSVVNKASKDPHTNAAPIEPQALASTITPKPQAVKLHDVSAWISDSHKKAIVDSLPTPQPKIVEVDRQTPKENIEPKLDAPEILPPPNIVVSDEPSEEKVHEPVDAVNEPPINSNAGARSRKVGLILHSEKLNDGMSEYYLKMLISNF